MANFAEQPLDSENGASISTAYDAIVADTAQGSNVAQATADGARTFQSTLSGQETATSGVSIDEETVNMITIQKSFQASARYISVISDLLDLLVKI